jgi:hypothetical protein
LSQNSLSTAQLQKVPPNIVNQKKNVAPVENTTNAPPPGNNGSMPGMMALEGLQGLEYVKD